MKDDDWNGIGHDIPCGMGRNVTLLAMWWIEISANGTMETAKTFVSLF